MNNYTCPCDNGYYDDGVDLCECTLIILTSRMQLQMSDLQEWCTLQLMRSLNV
jgi:hypothetical protein